MLKSNSKSSRGLLIALDFDGTLFMRTKSIIPPQNTTQQESSNPSSSSPPPHAIGHISDIDTNALLFAKQNIPKCFTVLASGRNLLSLCKTLGIESKHHPRHLQHHLVSMNTTEQQQQKVLPLPVDYVILGSGSLTMKWPSQEVIRTRAMSSDVAFRIAQRLILGDANVVNNTDDASNNNTSSHSFSFFLLKGPPHMDQSIHFISEEDEKPENQKKKMEESGFAERLKVYADSTVRVSKEEFIVSGDDEKDYESLQRQKEKEFHERHGQDGFSQFLIVFKDRSDPLIHVADELVSEAIHSDPKHGHQEDVSNRVRVSHTTSPVNLQGVWLEIFPSDISKSKGLDALEEELFYSSSSTSNGSSKKDAEQSEEKQVQDVFRLAVGNDHNDEDMLLWASRKGQGYLVAGSPKVIVEKHEEGKIKMLEKPCGSAIAEAVEKVLVSM